MDDYVTQAAAWIVIGGTLGLMISGIWIEIDRWRAKRRPPAPKIAGQYLRLEDRFHCVHGRPTYHSDVRDTFRCYAPEPAPADEQATDKIEERAA